ncbi:MAG: NAD(+) diphosphatase [Rhodobacteraceae bacterium]|nr:NAD(+) diphosphatase [Paracoccaceae bacterium]
MKLAESVTFGGAGFQRAAEFRTDKAQLAELLAKADARVLPVWRGKPLIEGKERIGLAYVSPGHPVLNEGHEGLIFLGIEGATPYFAMDVSAWNAPEPDTLPIGTFIDDSEQHHPALPETQRFVELRRNMTRLDAHDAELAAMSVGVFAWHRAHRFCARCGERSAITPGGWQRVCPSCKAHHFPRTDPVVIMLITCGNKVLLGRSPGWPEGMYSLLAGFMEPGETIETAVRREVYEETRIQISEVGYLASQPWPFPSSLMIGCEGRAKNQEITIDPKEIEDAIWTSREEILEAWATRSSTLLAARKGAIANFLIRNWLSDTLT